MSQRLGRGWEAEAIAGSWAPPPEAEGGVGGRLVAIRLPFDGGFLDALQTCWEAGEAVLPIHPGLPGPEVRTLLDELRPERLIEPEGVLTLPGAVAVDADTALVVPTSGTAGSAKGVELTHSNLAASAVATAARLGVEEGDRWLCCMPPSHIAGLMVLVRSRLSGTPPVMHGSFDPDLIAAERSANLISLVPTMLRRLLRSGADLGRFRWILLGGGPVPPDLVAAADAAGARVMTTYGMTETCGGVVYGGVPLPGVRVAILEEGEIALAGPMVMRGYRLRPEETAAALRDGWFHTSDAGELDDAGLRVFGRRDDLIVTGGEKVVPAEVEAVLVEHPGVADAAVVGRPDAAWGQAVTAVVVPAEGAAPSLAELRAFVTRRLAAYKAPRYLVLVSELPRGPTGKAVGLETLAAGASPATGGDA